MAFLQIWSTNTSSFPARVLPEFGSEIEESPSHGHQKGEVMYGQKQILSPIYGNYVVIL